MVSFLLSLIEPFSALGISPLILAVVLGAIFGNTAAKTTILLQKTAAVAISTKQILRLGIVLYGFRITFGDIAHVGFGGLALSFCIVFSTFFVGFFLGRALGLDAKSSILVSAGSAICGAAAVLATESIIKGGSQRVGVAVCTVVVFGTIGMFTYPILYKMGVFNLNLREMGFLMGGTLHEVAHAVAAGSAIGGEAANVTVIIKMIRVLMLVPFLLMIGIFSSVFTNSKEGGSFRKNIPYFALWFLVAVAAGSYMSQNLRDMILPAINFVDTFLLSIAMVALGITIRKEALVNAGKQPFILAAILVLWLVVVGYVMTILFI